MFRGALPATNTFTSQKMREAHACTHNHSVIVLLCSLYHGSTYLLISILPLAVIVPNQFYRFKLLSQTGAPAATTPSHDAAREYVWTKTKEILARQS